MKFLPRYVLLFLLALAARPAGAAPDGTVHDVPAQAVPVQDDLAARLRRLTPMQADEVLWLARCVYSESDRPHEQRLVAWVVRNRVETRYRGYTYREVVLETKQFSAFNAPSARREHLLGLDFDTPLPAWRSVLAIALDVYTADARERPFAVTTRHFYSPVSMVGRKEPAWAEGVQALSSTALGVDPHRFQFFAGVDPELGGTPASILDGAPPAAVGAVPVVRTGTTRSLPRPKLRGSVARPVRPTVRRPGL